MRALLGIFVVLLLSPAIAALSLSQALTGVIAGYNAATQLSLRQTFWFLDEAGRLKAMFRMDGAMLASIGVAEAKARYSYQFNGYNVSAFMETVQPGKDGFQLPTVDGGYATIRGGIPLVDGSSNTIGHVGVSGAASDLQDLSVARSIQSIVQSTPSTATIPDLPANVAEHFSPGVAISFAQAYKMVQAAINNSTNRIAAAVYDALGQPKGVVLVDQLTPALGGIAQAKAKTAAMTGYPSEALAGYTQPGDPASTGQIYMLQYMADWFVTGGGGLPIHGDCDGGKRLMGSIAVSGSPVVATDILNAAQGMGIPQASRGCFGGSTIRQGYAQAGIAAVLKKAESDEVQVAVAIIDNGGNVVSFYRQDGAQPFLSDIATQTGRAAAMLSLPSDSLAAYLKPGGSLYDFQYLNGGMALFAGGVPVMANTGINNTDVPVGAIGVACSGGAAKAKELAQVGADAITEAYKTNTVGKAITPSSCCATSAPGEVVSLAQAQQIVDAALAAQSNAAGAPPVAVHILDASGRVKLSYLQDNVALAWSMLGLKKAQAAWLTGNASDGLMADSMPDGQYYKVQVTNDRMMTVGGGLPLLDDDDQVVGSIGLSGNPTAAADVTAATAGVNAVDDDDLEYEEDEHDKKSGARAAVIGLAVALAVVGVALIAVTVLLVRTRRAGTNLETNANL